MKKHFKAWAIILSLVLFFNSIYSCKRVYALTGVEEALLIALLTAAVSAIGYNVTSDGYDWLANELGWRSSDLQTDENGNVILSPEQMDELKHAMNKYTQDENGEDKYGMYFYESNRGCTTVEAAMILQTYDLSKSWNRELLSSSTGHIWVRYVSSTASGYATFAPNGAVWIAPSSGYAVTFYNQAGTGFVYTDDWYFVNSSHTWSVRSQVYTSCGAASIYGGPGHAAFETIEGYRSYLADGSPYTMVSPTYTGGNLVISPDQLQTNPDDPDNPGGNDGEDGDTSTELGVLQEILKYVKKIYHQVIVGNIISAVDAVAQVMDTAKNYIDEALEDVSAIGELAEVIDTKFPFSIPQDILLILTVFEAEPQTPVFEIPFRADFGGPTGIKIDETIVVDFSNFDECIDILKWFMSIIWLWGLVMITPKFIDIGGLTTG